ncbi:ABC transporter ATP-binding protein [Aurantiacibacter sediminis]|uniref:ATP-binding cassette domain-containing protein n=1 Tax=Aurantiacibacter sediminis TaxID=2793064 RepID=A0ABS0N6H1_9SPHN|nr:ATP-binding cassette domain-containing protein [Aurantiacibacter sediminis]MBH5323361.1 ATP-binding cassette domain-containing protein [Aurantiacibacter sediminis]
MNLAIETSELRKSLGTRLRRRAIIRGCDLKVPRGKVYGFIGPNGAGKTTMMRLLLGILRPDAGTVRLLGHDMADRPHVALRRIGAFVESPALYDHLSGTANLDITRRLLGLPETEVARVLDIVGMTRHAARKVRDYSLGMKQRTALARTLLGAPELLMLDEPTNGLDPEGISEMRDLIRDLPDRIGATVFVSSHLLAEVEQVADYAGLLRDGQLAMQGPLTELLASERVLRLKTDQTENTLRILKIAGLEPRTAGREYIALSCPAGEDFFAFSAAINARLVDAGILVGEIVEQRQTLEDLYRQSAGAGLRKDAA